MLRMYHYDSWIASAWAGHQQQRQQSTACAQGPSWLWSKAACGRSWPQAAGRLAVEVGWGWLAGRQRARECGYPQPSVYAFRSRWFCAIARVLSVHGRTTMQLRGKERDEAKVRAQKYKVPLVTACPIVSTCNALLLPYYYYLTPPGQLSRALGGDRGGWRTARPMTGVQTSPLAGETHI